jgi:hypothetical protein
MHEIELSGKWFGQHVELAYFDGAAGERFEQSHIKVN